MDQFHLIGRKHRSNVNMHIIPRSPQHHSASLRASQFITPVLVAPQYATHSDPNGTPDYLHVGRAGAEAEASTLDIGFFAPNHHWNSNAPLSMNN
jgi:hypothetical protein